MKQSPKRASPTALLAITKKLDEIEATGILQLDLGWLSNNLQRSIARYVKNLTAYRLRDLKAERRYTVLVCFLQELYWNMNESTH